MSSERKARSRVILIAVAGALAVILIGAAWAYMSAVFTNPLAVSQPPKPNPAPQRAASALPWLQDFGEAKARAARENKDILLSFEGSDWCIWCQRMEREIFTAPDFVAKAPRDFVLVKADFPRDEPARSQVENPAANEALQRQFGVTSFPAVVLTDANGDQLGAIGGFVEGGPGPLLAHLESLRKIRVERDQMIAEVDKQTDKAKLAAAKKVLDFLMQRNLSHTIKRHVPGWLQLAKQFDPKNEAGNLEAFFEVDWYFRFQAAPTAKLPELVAEVARWRTEHGEFKDKERAAFLWMELAKGKAELEDFPGAFRCLDEGRKLQPKDPRTRQQLQNGPLALGLGTGTAFAVSPSGHFLTNAHVVTGPGKIFLQLPGQNQLVSAKLIAEKLDMDIALLRIDVPKNAGIAPLPIGGDHEPRRGEEVGAWGFPLGTSFGQGLKLTKGVISGLPEPGSRNMLLLDLRINAGSSGSPLCDVKGNVIGIVAARSLGPGDSYGMAVPGKELSAFLAGLDLKSTAPSGKEPLSWAEIDRRVGAGVAMVIKAPPLAKKMPLRLLSLCPLWNAARPCDKLIPCGQRRHSWIVPG